MAKCAPPAAMSGEDFGPEDFAARAHVSRETLASCEVLAALLRSWSARHNLVSKASMAHLWCRHFWDSAQLVPRIPSEARRLVDLGSGAGFPGLVLAILLRTRPSFQAVLYEATAKKARFLEEVAANLSLPVLVRTDRIENALPEAFDVVTARACAPLDRLLAYAQRFFGPETVALFLKGQSVESELTVAHKSWRMKLTRHRSQSDPSGLILEIQELRRVRVEPHSKRRKER